MKEKNMGDNLICLNINASVDDKRKDHGCSCPRTELSKDSWRQHEWG